MNKAREWLKTGNRMQVTLVVIIAATIPCYCLGSLALWNARRERLDSTPTATMEYTNTPPLLASPSLTLPAQSPTVSQTYTTTPTFTPTITYVLPPSKTPTPSPSPQPSSTPEPTSTSTSTPEPAATETSNVADTPLPTDSPEP